MRRTLTVYLLIPVLLFSSLTLLPYTHDGASPAFHLNGVTSSGADSSLELFLGNNYHAVSNQINLEFTGMNVTVQSYGFLDRISFPSSLTTVIEGKIHYLQKFFPLKSFSQNTTYTPFIATSSASGSTLAYTPSQLSQYYGFKWDYSHGFRGQGITIVVIDAYGDPALQYDLNVFDNFSGLPPVNLTIQNVGSGAYYSNNSWALETALDVEWAHAMAPLAHILLLQAGNAAGQLNDAVSLAISSRLGNIISLSWGTPESSLSFSEVNQMDSVYSSAAASNITVLAASGDSGANDGTGGLTVNYPASVPTVTSVGGVSLFLRNHAYSEVAWGGISNGKTFGSGGGYSQYFSAPYWQEGVVNSSSRGVPDVAMIADPQTPVYVVMKGNVYDVGGTSLSTPIWAAVVAMMDQFNNRSMGNVNPLLYQMHNSSVYTGAFNQITSGSNGYYYAGPGWNPVTGLGTPHVSNLINYSKQLLQGYYSSVAFNGSGYDSPGISAGLSVNYNKSLAPYEGGFYYYLQYFSSSQNNVRGGLLVYNNSEYLMLSVEQNGTGINKKILITHPTPGLAVSGNLYLSVNQTYVTLSSGSSSIKLDVFLTGLGMMYPGVGASSYHSYDNLIKPFNASFTSVKLHLGSASTTPSYAYETHGSAFPDPGYNSINIYSSSPGNYSVTGSYSQKNGSIDGGTPAAGILYSISLQNPSVGNFTLSSPESNTQWHVNGSPLLSPSYKFPGSAIYNVTATFSGGSVTRMIYVPSMSDVTVTVNNSVPYYSVPVTLYYDMFHQTSKTISGTGTFSVPTYLGFLPLQIVAGGYFPISTGFNTSSATSVSRTIIPEPVNVSVYTFPSNSAVHLNSTSGKSTDGYTYFHVTPARYQLSVTHLNFSSYSSSITLYPGTNALYSVVLHPDFNAFLISGVVKDYSYGFPLSSVEVNSTGFPTGYSAANGSYYIYLSPGSHNITFSKYGYNSTEVSYDVTSNATLNITMKAVFLATNYPVKLGFSYPFLFDFLYISWSFSGTTPAYFMVEYSTDSSFGSPNTISVPGTSSSKLISLSSPQSTHYVQVLAYLSNGMLVGQSQVMTVNPLSLYNLMGNVGMIMLIVVYAAFTVNLLRRRVRTPPL